jgi:predicted amidophosphoribosyltransferase
MIDDAVGSGATMNEIAKKLKSKNVASSVIGIAITGSFKGFDVITDV